MDHTFAVYILPRLKRFKEITNAFPGDLEELEWNNRLDKMIIAFELLSSDECYTSGDVRIQEGLDLFAKHFRSLWW